MSNRIYVGNLSFNTDERSLESAFSRFGETQEDKLVMDRETGRSRGFGFVAMVDAESARQAISEMDGTMLDGRALRVREAEERNSRGGGGRSGGGGFGGGGFGGDRNSQGGGSRRW
jgi:RNA recognition motif-containing protein